MQRHSHAVDNKASSSSPPMLNVKDNALAAESQRMVDHLYATQCIKENELRRLPTPSLNLNLNLNECIDPLNMVHELKMVKYEQASPMIDLTIMSPMSPIASNGLMSPVSEILLKQTQADFTRRSKVVSRLYVSHIDQLRTMREEHNQSIVQLEVSYAKKLAKVQAKYEREIEAAARLGNIRMSM
jgi:hypothetical protein